MTNCYVCEKSITDYHEFYEELCVDCGKFNFLKRNQTADLTGLTSVVTGGRIKIGFEVALKLLRAGARVIVTSRFKKDTIDRFSRESDFAVWKKRLVVYSADFRDVTSVQYFAEYLISKYQSIDILVNNAAQTLRRPPIFYRHLVEKEFSFDNGFLENELSDNNTRLISPNVLNHTMVSKIEYNSDEVAMLSQIPLLPEDDIEYCDEFPKGKYDKDGQQEDRRESNSWMMRLADINLIEFLEVMHINMVAPFILSSRLRTLMMKDSSKLPSFIINVSAMEGNFYDPEKNCRHVHTNMAKAALNMMTRTSAMDYVSDNIYMNAVDTGWITNEKPFSLAQTKQERKVKMAIDEVDGAARICDPIFSILNGGERHYGKLFKNYRHYPW